MNIIFRQLRADEIECRIASCNQYGIQLLLFKNARCDMNILDETVSPLNWKREHHCVNGLIYCTVSIFDAEKNEWVSKQDIGTESNTEKEKSQSSDSFKRACVNWGIGRELYSCPSLFIFSQNLKTHQQVNGKWKCSDSFKVTEIKYNQNNITYVKLYNTRTNQYIDFGNP